MMRKTGIALVVTLLIALVLFVAVLAVSSSLGLSSKRAASEQRVSLEAQYAAESGLALAATQLSTMGNEVAKFIKVDSGFELPASTDWLSLRPYVISFCGATSASLPASQPSPGTIVCSPDPADTPVFLSTSKSDWVDQWADHWRDPGRWSDPAQAPYALFLDHIDPAQYPSGVSPEDFWKHHIGPQTVDRTLKTNGSLSTQYTVTYGFAPYRAEILADGSLRFIYRALPTVATGQLLRSGNEVGLRKLRQEYTGYLRVDVHPPSFSHYMLFTNYQRAGSDPGSSRVFFYDGTLFDGPVHTNEHFNFTGAPWFGDSVTSAGCKEDHTNAAGDKECVPGRSVAGFNYWDKAAHKAVFTPPVDPIPGYMNTNPDFTTTPDWNASYIPLPKNSQAQYTAAKSGGLFIRDDDAISPGKSNVDVVTLSTKTVGGVKYQFVQVSYRVYKGMVDPPPRCVKNPAPGGGGGGGGGPTPPPPPAGPDVLRPVYPFLLAAAQVGTQLGAPHPLRLALATASSRIQLAWGARALSCPPGYHEVDPPPHKKTDRRTYAYRIDPSGKVERNDGSGWTFVQSGFNGVIYVGKEVSTSSGVIGKTGSFLLNAAGKAEPDLAKWDWYKQHNPRTSGPCSYTPTPEGKCVEPSIASFAQLTVVGKNITIMRDLTYEDRPCSTAPERQRDGSVIPASCDNASAQNVLGVYSDRGFIKISNYAPNDMFIDGVLMAAQKSVFYEGWKTQQPKGYLHLTGGIIQNWYGRFGRLKPDLTIKNGYGRKFTYDPRMKSGMAPPFFPKFEGSVPWTVDAAVEQSTGGATSGFWKPVEGK